MNAPCKDCSDRILGCHITCEKYKEFQVANTEEKKMIYRKKQTMFNADNFRYEGMRRMMYKK